MSEDDKKALKIAHETYARYWSTEFHRPSHALQSCITEVKKCVEVNDEIGTKAWLIIMLSPAIVMTSSIAGVRKYFDILVEESEFTYTYDEETWSEVILALLESHAELMKAMKGEQIDLKSAESALRYLLMESTDYYKKLRRMTSSYALAYILPLEVSLRAKGLKLNDVLTINKTMYSAIRRSKRAMSLISKTKSFTPNVETFADFADLLAVYNIALSAGYISYRDAKLISLALTDGNFEVHGSLEKVSLEDTLDFPEVEVGDVDFGDN